MLGTNPYACRCLFPLCTKRQIIWYLPFFIIWIDSDALCKTFIYLLCGFYNGWIQNCWPVQLWLCSAWNLWKTCLTKINFMIIGTIYFRYTEISTVYKLVHMIPSQCLEEVFDVSISILYEDSDLERLSNLPKKSHNWLSKDRLEAGIKPQDSKIFSVLPFIFQILKWVLLKPFQNTLYFDL